MKHLHEVDWNMRSAHLTSQPKEAPLHLLVVILPALLSTKRPAAIALVAAQPAGLVLGWSNGPWSALQSCAGLGLISALIDLGGGVEAAEARTLQPLQHAQPYTHFSHSTASQQQAVSKRQHHDGQQQQRMQATGGQMQSVTEQQQGACGAQALAGLPQPAQLLALLMGASPHSMSDAAAAMHSKGEQLAARSGPQGFDTNQRQQEQQAQQHGSKRSRKQQAQQRRVDVYEPTDSPALMQQQQRALQYQLQQPLATAALLMQPATRAVQQLMSAPPLMFLGACCNSNQSSSFAGGHSFAAAAEADIDACPLAVASAASATVGNKRK